MYAKGRKIKEKGTLGVSKFLNNREGEYNFSGVEKGGIVLT